MGSYTITTVLDGQQLELLGANNAKLWETLVVAAADNTRLVNLYGEPQGVTISILTCQPPSLAPHSGRSLAACDVTAVVSVRGIAGVDSALRTVFREKYQLLLDVEDTTFVSPERSLQGCSGRRRNSMDEKSRFSHPVKEQPRKQGCMVKSRRPPMRSPSTASTTSLAQLHDKLSALPYYEFTKEPVSVVAHPELSVVSEQNESDISNSLDSNSTLKLRRCAERSSRARYIEQKKSQSDGEAVRRDLTPEQNPIDKHKNAKGSQSDTEYVKDCAKATQKVGAVSSLFAATIGSADESVLNATTERLPKEKALNTDNLIELLVQEALQSKTGGNDQDLDSGIITGDGKKTQEGKTQDSETIEDTQYPVPKVIQVKKNFEAKTAGKLKVVSKSTSDESNTEAINDTPVNYVNVRKRNLRRRSVRRSEKDEKVESVTYDVQEVEDFFSQHFFQNQRGDVIISPTLARKINVTSSETSEELLNIDEDFNICNEEMPDYEIVECLNDIVNKVCIDFEKCAEYLVKEATENDILNITKNISSDPKGNKQSKDVNCSSDETKDKENEKPKKGTRAKPKQVLKLKFPAKKQKTQKPKAKNKLKLEPVSKMSTIIEDNNETDANNTSSSDAKKKSDNTIDTTITRKRRKLYSPKDDEAKFANANSEETASNKPVETVESDEDDVALANLKKDNAVTPKSAATSYKDIEKDRQRYKIRRQRKTKDAESPLTQKTIRLNEVFEKLKEKVESNEKILLADKKSDKDIAIFNYTSDSEDEDFQQKKIDIQKRTSTTTIGSGTSVMSTRRGRAINKVNYAENDKGLLKETTNKPAKRKRVTKRKNVRAKASEVSIEPRNELIDERMREAAPEVLDTSFPVEKVANNTKHSDPIIKPPELEPIEVENAMQHTDKGVKAQTISIEVEDKKRKTKKTEKHHPKKQEVKKPTESVKDDDRTLSPLPGLIIETEKVKDDGDESLTTNFVQKVQKIYKEGPDACYDTTGTQNMISDNDGFNCSPQMNITEELGKITEADLDKQSNERRKENKERQSQLEKKISDVNTINDTMTSDDTAKSKIETKKSKRNKLRLKPKDKTDSSLTSNSVKNSKLDREIYKNTLEKQDIKYLKKVKPKSKIQEIYCEEIINIETQIITRSKSNNSMSKSKELDVIDITGMEEVPSEVSIATDGITAHGDLSELPPCPKLLNEKLSHRELVDMDQNMKDYYVELNKEVNRSRDTDESNSNEIIVHENEAENNAVKRAAREINSSSTEQKSKENDRNIFDYDVTKWLPSLKGSDGESCGSSRKIRSPTVSLTKLTPEDIAKWLPSAKSTPEASSAENLKEIRRSPRLARKRQSQISPIQLEDFMIKTKPKAKQNTSGSNDTNSPSAESGTKRSKSNRFMLRPTYESSPISRCSKSEDSPPKVAQKRTRSPVVQITDVKRRKLDFKLETSNKSGTSQSSNVDEWLRKISASSKADDVDVSQDTLQNLMEKLDTTLAEIHQNTAKDFIGLFVEAQERFAELKEQRRKEYRETAVGILTAVTQLIDAQFSEMDQRAADRDGRITSWLKQRAGEVLRRDCRQKRAMVAMLKEDVQHVQDFIARKQRNEE